MIEFALLKLAVRNLAHAMFPSTRQMVTAIEAFRIKALHLQLTSEEIEAAMRHAQALAGSRLDLDFVGSLRVAEDLLVKDPARFYDEYVRGRSTEGR